MDIDEKRIWQSADWFMLALRAFGFIVSLTNMYDPEMVSRLGFILPLAILSFAVPQLFYLPSNIRVRTFIVLEFIMSGGYTLYLMTITQDAQSYFFLPLLVISYLCAKKALIWVAPLGIIGFPLAAGWVGALTIEEIVNLALNVGLFAVFGYGFGVLMLQRLKLASALRQVERITVLEERNRMSRELHDTVGHSLTASIVAMEAVHTLIDRDPLFAKERLGQLITFNRNHLDVFRRTVHDMAFDPVTQPMAVLLREAAAECERQTGMRVIVACESETGQEADEATKLALLRCLQESLTNAIRHGGATEVRVSLYELARGIQLTTQDNGEGAADLQEGFGLTGMRARVEALQGKFQISSTPNNGTRIQIDIPRGA